MRTFNIICFLLIFQICAYSQNNIPKLNQQIVKYVSSVIGKKVDRGECWDLANEALTLINAKWNHEFKYGILLDPKKDSIYPGDIIQFKNVVLEYDLPDGSGKAKETMEQHTAIVYKVFSQGNFEIAHQNTGFSGRKVGTSKLNLKNRKKGKIFIYRPINS
jgi:hypothetical protein